MQYRMNIKWTTPGRNEELNNYNCYKLAIMNAKLDEFILIILLDIHL